MESLLGESDDEEHTVVSVNASGLLRAMTQLASSTANSEALHQLLTSIRIEDHKLLKPLHSITANRKRSSNEEERTVAEKTGVLREGNGNTPPKRRRLLQTEAFECDVCETIYSTKSALKSHVDKEHASSNPTKNSESQKYQCALCPKKRAGIYEHYKAVHHIECPEQVMFYTGNVLVHSTIDTQLGKAPWFLREKQRAKERNTNVTCRLCERILLNPAMLSDHYTMVHMVEPTMLNNIENMFRAEKGAHLNLTALESPNKRKSRSNSTSVQTTPDAKNENRNNVVCRECNRSYSNKANLMRHIKKSHPVKKPEATIEALLNKHKNQTPSPKIVKESSHKSVNYKCALCDKNFTSTSIYKHYGNFHDIEYPEQLMFIGGRVLVLSDINTQDGKAPWFLKEKEKVTRYTVKTCRLCDTEFNSSVMLKTHYALHHKVIQSAFYCLQYLFRAQKGAHLADMPASVKKVDHKNNSKVNFSKLNTEIKNQKPEREIEKPSNTHDSAIESRPDNTVNIALQKVQNGEPLIGAQPENQSIENLESNVVRIFCEECKTSINITDSEAHAATHINEYQHVLVNGEDNHVTESEMSLEPPVRTQQGSKQITEDCEDEDQGAHCAECNEVINLEDLDAHAELHKNLNQQVTVNENDNRDRQSDTSAEPIRTQQGNEQLTENSEDVEDAFCEECNMSINLADLDAHADLHKSSIQSATISENDNAIVESDTLEERPIRAQQENERTIEDHEEDESAFCEKCNKSINFVDLDAHADSHKNDSQSVAASENHNSTIDSDISVRTEVGNEQIIENPEDESAFCEECNKFVNFADLDAHAKLHNNNNQSATGNEKHNPTVDSDTCVEPPVRTEQGNEQTIDNPEDDVVSAFCEEGNKLMKLVDLEAHAELPKKSNQRVAVTEKDNPTFERDTSQKKSCLSTNEESENSENIRQYKIGTDTVESWNSDNDSCYSLRISTMTVKAQMHCANEYTDCQSQSTTGINDADNITEDTMEYENTEDVLKTIELNDFSDEFANDLKRDLLNLGLSQISPKTSIIQNKTANTQELLEILQDDSSGPRNSKMNSGRECSESQTSMAIVDQDKECNERRGDQGKEYNDAKDDPIHVSVNHVREDDATEKLKEFEDQHVSQDIFTSDEADVQDGSHTSKDKDITQTKNLNSDKSAVSTNTEDKTNANDFIDLTDDNDEHTEGEIPQSPSILTMVLAEDKAGKSVAVEDGEEIDRQSLIDDTDRIRAIMFSRD